ncbi:MAG: glycosyltransferase family 4 protein, partial [Candidatus Kryptonium sp.]
KVVLTHRYKLLRYLWFCKLFYPKLKIIFHAVISGTFKGCHRKILFKIFKRKIDKILVNSLALKEEMISQGLVRENEVEILYSGIDLSEFDVDISKEEVKIHYNLPLDVPILGMIARFRGEKDQRCLIWAVKKLKDNGYNLRLILVGDGPYEDRCKKLVEHLGLMNEVIFFGRVSANEVPKILKALDLFVYATNREGMPLAVLEAMASGLPIIATDAEGIPDLFQDELTFGIMVPKGDPQALASAIEKILNLPEDERLALGKNAREVVAKRFSAEILKDRTIKLFKEMLDLS